MPRKVAKASKRRELAAAAIAAEGDTAACAPRRFPKDLVVVGDTPQTLTTPDAAARKKYADLVEVRGGASAPITSAHFRLMESSPAAHSEVGRMCGVLTAELGGEISARAGAHRGRRIFGAVTDRWLCVQTAQLCANEDVPVSGDDDEDSDL